MQLDDLTISSSPTPPHTPPSITRRKRLRFRVPKFKISKKKIIIRLAILLGIGAVGCVLIGVGMFAWFSRELPNPNKLIERTIPLSTKIYDRTGEHVLYEIHGNQQRTLVKLEDIPQYAREATIAVEDKSFFTHKGFDFKGIVRSILVNILKGGKAQGGSTITQQFIKNALLTNEKTYIRKIKELVLSYQLERNFSKDQILQLYFNEIPYGSTAYGIQSAAHIYFNKDIKDVTLGEAAILAALPQSPTRYSPWGSHRDELIARQHLILDLMVQQGFLKEEDAQKAKQEKITFAEQRGNITAPHFVFYVKEQLSKQYDEKTIEQGGLKVITSLDYDRQIIAEDAIKKGAARAAGLGASNAALLSMDAKTGEILSMVGSKDYFDESIDGNVNVVLAPRQPGSSFKPIAFATAFAKGYSERTIVYDVLTNFAASGNAYIPKNYTGKEYGPISLKQALAGSLNISSVKVLYLAGLRNTLETAKKMGYTTLTDPDRYGLTLVLGGGEVTLLEHVAAFTTFAREGKRVEPTAILKIQDRKGDTLYEFKEPKKTDVFEPNVARQINDILSDNNARSYVFGASNFLTLGSRPVAAKTGTTNDYRDAWTIGYTPSIVTGVWVGNNDNKPMKRADGSQVAAPIWNEYMRRVLGTTPIEVFKEPEIAYTGKDMLDGRVGEEKKVKVNKQTGKLATDFTPAEFVEERTYRTIHNILHYINKDDPKGDYPANPMQDPQYRGWENAIQDWAKRNNIITDEKPPTEYDDIYTPFNVPTLSITSPAEGDIITGPNLDVSVQTSAQRGIARVEYFLDGGLLATVTTNPFFDLHHPLTGNENGFRTLTVKSYDDVGNMAQATMTLNFVIKK